MKRVLCILADLQNNYANEQLGSGITVLGANASSLLALQSDECILLHTSENLGDIKSTHEILKPRYIRLQNFSWQEVLEVLAREVTDVCTVMLAFADSPFINKILVERLLQLHETYKAHFTFADAYPGGFALELVDSEALLAMSRLAARQTIPFGREGLFEVLRGDVNAFDIETDIASDDMRMLRLQLYATNAERLVILRSLYKVFEKAGQDPSPEELSSLIRSNEKLLRSIPNFFNIQLATNCPQACSYCPWGILYNGKGPGTDMPLANAKSLVDQIAKLNPEASLSVSLWGEPALYKDFDDFIHYVLTKKDLKLIVETSGLAWPKAAFARLAEHLERGRITWIVSLDARDDASYRTMRGEGFLEAWACARELKNLFGAQVYVQAVRCKTNEAVIQKFYQESKAEGFQVIIQKFDHFSHAIPDLRVADIAPFHRFPCWHNKRDMHILADGRVVQCKEDLKAEHVWGNAFTEDLLKIWDRGSILYLEQTQKKYSGMCEFCDEYYTYNA